MRASINTTLKTETLKLYAEGSDDLLKTIEDDEDVSIYPNYYLEI